MIYNPNHHPLFFDEFHLHPSSPFVTRDPWDPNVTGPPGRELRSSRGQRTPIGSQGGESPAASESMVAAGGVGDSRQGEHRHGQHHRFIMVSGVKPWLLVGSSWWWSGGDWFMADRLQVMLSGEWLVIAGDAEW